MSVHVPPPDVPLTASSAPSEATARRAPNLAALAWMLTASLLFAVMNVLGRKAGTHHVAWPLIALIRALAGLVVSYAFVRASRAPVLLRGSKALWTRTLFGVLAMAATFYVLGGERIALGDAVTLFNLMPIFVAMIAPVALGERTGPRLAIALPVAVVGVLFVVKPPLLFGHGASATDARAVVACVVAALFASIAMMGLRRVGPREPAESIALHFSVVASLVMAVLAVPTFELPRATDLILMVGGGLAAGLAQIAMTKAYTLERAALVASYGYSNVVFTAFIAAAALGELPDAMAAMGMVLVVGAGVAVTLTSGRRAS